MKRKLRQLQTVTPLTTFLNHKQRHVRTLASEAYVLKTVPLLLQHKYHLQFGHSINKAFGETPEILLTVWRVLR
jgi:hypothetical protein